MRAVVPCCMQILFLATVFSVGVLDVQRAGEVNIFDTENSEGVCKTEGTLHNHGGRDDELYFQPLGMRQVTIEFGGVHTYHVLQATSSFCSTGADDTGLVVWGPSVALSQYMIKKQSDSIVGKRILELGCGAALPSLVAYRLGAAEVIATDFRPRTLAQVQYQTNLNQCPIHIEHVDWKNPAICSGIQPDIVLAADVIYGLALVPALVDTIRHVLPKTATLVIATKDGRHGIPEFRKMMEKDFMEEQVEFSTDRTSLPVIPQEINLDPPSRNRWDGKHSIFIYRWRNTL